MDKIFKKFALGLLFWGFAQVAYAQPFAGQSTRPVLSPYLGLSGNGIGFDGISNYFTIVQPQIQAQEALQRQQSQIGSLQRQARAAAATASNRNPNPIQQQQIRGTGHGSTFNSYSHFYTIREGRRQ